MLIQKLRLKRGWSQQQLADASGLSARTIQRLENGHAASTESLKCLAAVFEVDFATLAPGDTMDDRKEQEAFRYVRRLRGFYVHLFQYVFVIAGLAAINLIFMPRYLWVIWVMAGWGIGLFGHAFMVFRPAWFLGPEWERAQVEKRLGRSL
ncbi:MAG: helix-turn-helix domain-containing protein [Betaproteobacteria bacterium]|nr:helix-turn-helix domain-containing protein [Betaproteobacteria bacterium]MBV9362251.1 helix-turn-helix domain-containing protein [Betaproteobacteria bacterium]